MWGLLRYHGEFSLKKRGFRTPCRLRHPRHLAPRLEWTPAAADRAQRRDRGATYWQDGGRRLSSPRSTGSATSCTRETRPRGSVRRPSFAECCYEHTLITTHGMMSRKTSSCTTLGQG